MVGRRGLLGAVLLAAGPVIAATPVRLTYADATSVIEAMPSNLPAGLRGRAPAELAGLWPAWVARRDAEIRARLARGEEDSVVNLWMYGTSFTAQPRSTGGDNAVGRRLDEFLAAVASPGSNERLQFAAAVLKDRGVDPSTGPGRQRARRFLIDLRRRMLEEFAATDKALAPVLGQQDPGARAAAYASVFRDRGLSSDTSVLPDYGVATALDAMAKSGMLAPASVRQAAVVGPGLDFTNKADGYDFYPQQTIQPFALIDSLRRAGVAAVDLRVTTFDVSRRVNAHLDAAVDRAAAAVPYLLTLPLDAEEAWTPGLLAYWKQFGSRIGGDVAARRSPPAAGTVRVRAVSVSPSVVRSIAPRELNVVFERLEGLAVDERFDLIVATNVLVYYDVFEQALALANVAAMLRPGGVFLTNNAAFPTPPLKPAAHYAAVTYSNRQYDEFFWYQKE